MRCDGWIRSSIHWILPLFSWMCEPVRCLCETALLSSPYATFSFLIFFCSNDPIMLHNNLDSFSFFKIAYKYYATCILKHTGSWLRLWAALTRLQPLWWLFSHAAGSGRHYNCIKVCSMDSCFIQHCESVKKLIWITLKCSQIWLWIMDTLLFLVICKETRHPSRTKIFHM